MKGASGRRRESPGLVNMGSAALWWVRGMRGMILGDRRGSGRRREDEKRKCNLYGSQRGEIE